MHQQAVPSAERCFVQCMRPMHVRPSCMTPLRHGRVTGPGPEDLAPDGHRVAAWLSREKVYHNPPFVSRGAPGGGNGPGFEVGLPRACVMAAAPWAGAFRASRGAVLGRAQVQHIPSPTSSPTPTPAHHQVPPRPWHHHVQSGTHRVS